MSTTDDIVTSSERVDLDLSITEAVLVQALTRSAIQIADRILNPEDSFCASYGRRERRAVTVRRERLLAIQEKLRIQLDQHLGR